MRKTLISLCAAAALAGCVGDAKIPADVQVAPEGAVKSPAAALAEVRKLRAAGKIPAARTAVVSFAPGVYELEETLEVTAAEAPVRLVGAERGETVFSGGRTLQPFTARPDGVWRCKVPDGLVFEQLWVNGERAERAKSPNGFYHYVLRTAGEEKDPATGRVADMSRRTFYTDPAALACLAKIPPEELAEVAIHVWWAWDAEWQIPLSVDAAKGSVTLKKPVGRDFFMWAKWCPRFTIENCRAALDAPGEWFLDRRKGELLYIPRAGETLSETKAVAPALKRIAYVHDAKGVSFERIAFEHNGWSVGDGFYAHQSAFFADAALQVRDADAVAFRNCRVAHTADYGLWFGEGARDSSVTHTLFEDLGAGGVRLGSRTWTTNTPPEKVTQRVTVDDNIVFSGGHVFPAGTGVFVTYAKNCRVTHNEICDLYYSGVCCGWHWGYGPTPNRDNEISWNHIRHLGKGVLSDMGFIYTLGDSRGTVIAGNHGHDIFSYGYTGSGGTGLYPDEGSRGILWTSNLVHHTKTSALSQHYGRDNFFHNNIFAFATKPETSVAGRWRVQDHTSLVCSNNVFVWSGKNGGKAWKGPGGRPGSVKDLVFGSNLWWSPDPIADDAFNGGTWEAWRKSGMDAGSLVADPLFRDWAHGDWRLKPESPAFRIGFKEWDYTLAGVRKDDPAWRAKAAALAPAGYKAAPEPPLNPGKKDFFSGFETRAPGTFPRGAFGTPGIGEKYGYVFESTCDRLNGKQSLEIRDLPGLKPQYLPHVYQHFKIASDRFTLKFAVKGDKSTNLECTFREWSSKAKNGMYADGPSFTIANGRMLVDARKRAAEGKFVGCHEQVKCYEPGKWLKVAFTLKFDQNGQGTWDFAVDSPDGAREEFKDLHFRGADCQRPNWIGFMSNADCKTSAFIDDYSYENVD